MGAAWFAHTTSACPVPPDTIVYVRWKIGKESAHPYKAGALRWKSWSPAGMRPHDYDITHYRVQP